MIIKLIKTNITTLLKYMTIYLSSFTTFACVWLSFISWDDMEIDSKFIRIIILLVIIVLAFIAAIFTVVVKKTKKVFGDTNKGLTLCYGDIIKLGFPKRKTTKHIIVIPVNRCFDLSCENNLISEKSIHGQWINKYITSKKTITELHQKIEHILANQKVGYIELDAADKKCGYLKRYEPGTIVELKETNGVIFYLWGVSELDSDLKANCTDIDYFKGLQNLIEYYDAHGQCLDLYCPVFGDHIIRPTKSTDNMLHFMISLFKINEPKIHGNIHIVVYKHKKKEISIFDY